MVFLTSLQSIMPIVLLISLGYFLKGRGMFNDTFSSNLSRLIMSVILPVGRIYVRASQCANIGFVGLAVWITRRDDDLCSIVHHSVLL